MPIFKAFSEAILVLVISSRLFFVKLADVVFCPIPLIQIGHSDIFLAFSSDARIIDELPEHEREQSKILRSSVICFEFIISDMVFGSLLYACGLSIACL